jgi:hypothetical protein
MAIEPSEETPEEKALREESEFRKENERWKDYASALLIAMPVLLAALAISGLKTCYSIISAFAAVAGIVLVVLWYARDTNYHQCTPSGKYPTFLYYASWCFGIQVVFLCFAFLNVPCILKIS